jgi:CSLREA domain-containing protein
VRRGLTAVVVILGTFVVQAPGALAAINVNTTKDETISGDGSCSLREAVLAVDGSPSPDCPGSSAPAVTTIVLERGTYHLSLGTALILVRPVEIEGTGDPSQTVIDGDHHDRVLQMDSGQATLANLTITGGRTRDGSAGADGTASSVDGQPGADSEDGGGIDNDGTLNIVNSVITGNATGQGGLGGTGSTGSVCGGGGMGGSAGGGGGIHNSGEVTLTRVTLTDNSTGDGGAGGGGGSKTSAGAGCAAGPSGSGGDGAGILNQGSLTLVASTVSDNRTGNGGAGGAGGSGTPGRSGGVGGDGGSGAGIASTFNPLTVSGSTISGNLTGNGGAGGRGGQGTDGAAGGDGGSGGLGAGIWSDGIGTGSVLNSTVAANTAGDGGYGGIGGFGGGVSGAGGTGGDGGTGGSGGGIYEAQPGSITVSSATVADNVAGGGGNLGPGGDGNGSSGIDGILGDPGSGGGLGVEPAATLSEQDSISASNSPGNCAGLIVDGGHNLSFPDTSCPHAVSGDPKLGQLAAYGGLTETMGLGSGSAAINQVPATGAGCPITDQRGVVRPQPSGGACDIGAYEYAPPVCRAIAVATHGTRPVTVQLSCGDPAKLALSYSIVRHPAHGKLSSVNGSKITYTARSGFTGRDQFTYRAVNLNGTSGAQTATVSVAAVPLTISSAHLSKKRFHAGSEVKIQFMLSLAAQVKVTITHLHHGRAVTNGSFSAHEHAGKVSLGFDGTIAGTPLAHGSYTAKLVATVGSRKSKPVSLGFTIS